MKFPYFKTLAVVGALTIAWSCSEDSAANVIPQAGNDGLAFWAVNDGVNNYYVSPTDMIVYGDGGVVLGTFDVATGSIIIGNTPVLSGLDLNMFGTVPASSVIPPSTNPVIDVPVDPTMLSSAAVVTMSSAALPTQVSSSSTAQPTVQSSSATQPQQKSSSSVKTTSSSSVEKQIESSSSKKQEDQKQTSGSITATGSLDQTVAPNGSISKVVFSNVTQEPQREWNIYFVTGTYDKDAKTYTLSGTVPDYLSEGSKLSDKYTFADGSFTFNLTISKNGSQAKSSSSQAKSSSSVKSSSSQAKSSSSQPKSSSSQPKSSSSQQQQTSGCPAIKYVNGGASGSGWATRYWDCCKPSCAWQENSGGNPASQCTNKGTQKSSDWGGQSVCSGGQLMTCTSQIPFTVNGCTDIAFAFAAVPASNGGQCGHCYELTFTGEGHYSSTNANTKAIKGKKLIVMASNIGGDVAQGQFDVMIPGGGTGAFDGCSSTMGWGNQGERYGGLLSDCEKSTNYNASKMLTCLEEKCNSSFGSDSKAKEGCLFLAGWMHAAGNPEHTFKEVECPQVLKDKW